MSKVTKAQLSELEALLDSLREYMNDRGAPRSLVHNVDDMKKSINWVRELKAKNGNR